MSSLQKHRSTVLAGRYGVLDKIDKHTRPGEALKQRIRFPVAEARAEQQQAIAELADALKIGRRAALQKMSHAQLHTMATGEPAPRRSPDNVLTKRSQT